MGYRYNTACLYIKSIGYFCKIRNCIDNSNSFLVHKTLEGLKRTGTVRRLRLPITQPLLASIISILPRVCFNAYEIRLFAAAFCLAFAAFLRVSEVTSVNKQSTLHALNIKDVLLDAKSESLFLCIRHSKADQFGKGVTMKVSRTNSPTCPVSHMRHYLEHRPSVIGPLFCHFDGSPLTRYQFSSVLKKSLAFLRPNYTMYTSHSFRIGAATAAAMAGYGDEVIKKAGRWNSEAFRLYIQSNTTLTLPIL